MGDIFKDYSGKWVFVKNINGDKYIGRCVNESTVDEALKDDYVKLQPSFYYIADYVQDGNGGIARQLLITPIELCIGFDSVVTVKNINFSIQFDEMSSEDRKQFESAVRQGVDGMIEAKAAKSGITLESSIPDSKNNGGLIFG
jgi:hypothetical protein